MPILVCKLDTDLLLFHFQLYLDHEMICNHQHCFHSCIKTTYFVHINILYHLSLKNMFVYQFMASFKYNYLRESMFFFKATVTFSIFKFVLLLLL